HALELMAVIHKESGLSHSVCDRLILAAAKQDGWTYDMKTIPCAMILSKAFESCARLGIKGSTVEDGLYGFIRFLAHERRVAIDDVKQTGTYGDGMARSQFDVSAGARVRDRFVFNQMRNAQ